MDNSYTFDNIIEAYQKGYARGQQFASKLEEAAPSTTDNIAMDAIVALDDLVSSIEGNCASPDFNYLAWVQQSVVLSHARKVLQQHQ